MAPLNGFWKIQSRILFLMMMLVGCWSMHAQTYSNPILPGGYPDPSMVFDGQNYYIVNSSFELFPGLPIHRSDDLVNWEPVGHGLERVEQLDAGVNLMDVQENGGIHAPSIRYHDGVYYLITTNIYSPIDPEEPTEFVNFILTASDPAGDWSLPHVIEGAVGIDPDLFFDDDGRAYFVGTHHPGNPEQNGIGEIWIQELDLTRWALIGDRHSVWTGACGGESVEGPHLYRRNGYYYLMVAEGGTGPNHAVMISVSDSIFGPYLSNPRNPILTARHLSTQNWVTCVGHADLSPIEDGRWYMVALGIRNDVDGVSAMGRESFLMPVSWEDATITWRETSPGNWEPLIRPFPVVAPQTGRVEPLHPLPFADRPAINRSRFEDSFNSTELHPRWAFRRCPTNPSYSLSDRRGTLRLFTHPNAIGPRQAYNFVGVRQTQPEFEWTAELDFSTENRNEEAGVMVVQGDDAYQKLTLRRGRKAGAYELELTASSSAGEHPTTVATVRLSGYVGRIQLRIVERDGKLLYSYSLDEGENPAFKAIGTLAGDALLCRDYVGGHVGLYASSNGDEASKGFADFTRIVYSAKRWP